MLIGYKSAFLQRIQEAAASGYTYAVTGKVHIDKFDNVYRKFNALYDIEMDKSRRARQKAKGVCVVRLLAHVEAGNYVRWVLIATDGSGVFHEMENKTKIKLVGIVLFGQYKFTRLTKKGFKKPVYTFILPDELMFEYQAKINQFIHFKNRKALGKLIFEISSLVKLHGIRKDIFTLYGLIKKRWSLNSGLGKTSMPVLPHIHYNRKLANEMVKPSSVLSRMRSKNETAIVACYAIVKNRRQPKEQ
jgi:hypothetical protein